METKRGHEICTCGHCRCGHRGVKLPTGFYGYADCVVAGCRCERWTWNDHAAPEEHKPTDKFVKAKAKARAALRGTK